MPLSASSVKSQKEAYCARHAGASIMKNRARLRNARGKMPRESGRASRTDMTELEVSIHDEIVSAMKRRDGSSLVPLRMLKAAVDNARIERGRDEPFSEEDVFAVIRRLVKQRKESADQFAAGGAHDRAQEEIREAELLSVFLPAPMDDEKIASVIRLVINETGAKGPSDMGRVMGRAMSELKGRVEGEKVRDIVMDILRSL